MIWLFILAVILVVTGLTAAEFWDAPIVAVACIFAATIIVAIGFII